MMEDAILRAVLRLRRRTSGIPGAPSGLGSGSDRGDEVGCFGEYHLILPAIRWRRMMGRKRPLWLV